MPPPQVPDSSTTTQPNASLQGQPQRQLQLQNRDLQQQGQPSSQPQPQQQQPPITPGQPGIPGPPLPGQQVQQYSIPGILHFLQFEWQRFEAERQQWSVERAELQARIALLQGERKGQENLKNDLIRRIKMLEFCLRQERAKYHKLKYGVDPPASQGYDDSNVNEDTFNEDPLINNNNIDSADSGVNWKQGRQLLRQYLQEIGYTDTIIDVRSNRVRSLLGLTNSLAVDEAAGSGEIIPNKPVMHKNAMATQVRRGNQGNAASSLISDTEASVLSTFEFLNDQRDGHAGRSSGDDDEGEEDEDIDEGGDGSSYPIDSATEEVLAEFDFLNSHNQQTAIARDFKIALGGIQKRTSAIPDIGELANLTLNNESEMNGSGPNCTSSLTNTLNPEYRKTWNSKYTLKSHFDCIRSLRFHHQEPILVTASEDETLKLWNLNKSQTQTSKGKNQTSSAATTFDLEPVYTFRGHTSKVLSLALEDNIIYSGAENGELFVWRIPDNMSAIDPYDSFDPSLCPGSFDGHADAIWSVICHTSRSGAPLLCSAAGETSVKIWDINSKDCIRTIQFDDARAKPTCISTIASSNSSATGSLIVVSFWNGTISVFDLDSTNANVPILSFDNDDSCRVNSVVVHPTMPVVVSAHEDRQIKFWDLNSGKCLHAMVAHLDEVTCLACDPNGLYLLSGSHDCSVRLWNFDNRTCVQEITSHRKKFDEAIFDVSFHPSKPFFASAGADALAKVYV